MYSPVLLEYRGKSTRLINALVIANELNIYPRRLQSWLAKKLACHVTSTFVIKKYQTPAVLNALIREFMASPFYQPQQPTPCSQCRPFGSGLFRYCDWCCRRHQILGLYFDDVGYTRDFKSIFFKK